MSVIRLKPFISDEQKDVSLTQREFDDFFAYLSDLWEDFPVDFSFTVESAYDQDNDSVVFRDVKFRVTSRYKLNGDRWLSGDGFAVNIDEVIKLIESAVE